MTSHYARVAFNYSQALPGPTFKYQKGVRGQATCAIKLHGNCITVEGGMCIIIHVHESPLCLCCGDAIPRTCDRDYEKRLVVSVGQATITQTFHIS